MNRFAYDDIPDPSWDELDPAGVQEVRNAVPGIVAGCKTDYEKVRAIYDWIGKNIAYDNESLSAPDYYTNADLYEKGINPVSTYKNGRGVCSGYSRLFRIMCGELHIPCLNIHGNGSDNLKAGDTFTKTNHEWNAVYLNGAWRLCDVTWDSPNKYYGTGDSRNVLGQSARHNYFLIEPELLSFDHCTEKMLTVYADPENQRNDPNEIIPVPVEGMPSGVMKDQNSGNYIFVDDTLGIGNYAVEAATDGTVFRMYNGANGEHFYTRSVAERNALIAGGWSYESDGDFDTVGAESDAIPVYRMYNPNNGLHHYTLNKGEAAALKNAGWSFEGVGFYG